VVVISLVVSLVAIAVAVLALRRADVVERRVSKRLGSAAETADVTEGEITVGDVAAGGARADDGLEGGIATRDRNAAEDSNLVERIAALENRTFDGISRVAVVRYDAFEGSGGFLSYSVALVDEQGHGLVLTSIHGQAETRTYVKEVPQSQDIARPVELSPEEREVLRKAAGSRGESQSARKKLGRKKPDRKSVG
jgi:hypothetical protein